MNSAQPMKYPMTTHNKNNAGLNRPGINQSYNDGFSKTQKRHGDVRLPGARSVAVEDLPSDISDDEWGEIQKFGQRLHEEKIRKEKENAMNKVRNVREVLDKQVAVRQELKTKAKLDREDFDRRILEQAKFELEQENENKRVLQGKVLQ